VVAAVVELVEVLVMAQLLVVALEVVSLPASPLASFGRCRRQHHPACSAATRLGPWLLQPSRSERLWRAA
jgi:hypothetical protein